MAWIRSGRRCWFIVEPMAAVPKNPARTLALLAPPPSAIWWRHLFVESEHAQLVCDRTGMVWDTNRRAEEQFGLSPKRCLFECGLLAPSGAEQLRQAFARVTERPESLGTIGISCPDGARVAVDLQLAPLDQDRCLLVIKDAS